MAIPIFYETLIKYIPLACVFLSFCAYAQKSSKIAGQYKISNEILIINPDNSFLIIGYGTLIKGSIEINGSTVQLKPYVPEHPFVLYGRNKQKDLTGSTILFKHFEDAETLVSYEESKTNPKKMKRVFNVDANCIEYPNVLSTPNSNLRFCFAINGSSKIYTFENKEDYNDFIVVYLKTPNNFPGLNLTLKEDGQTLLYQGEALKKLPSEAVNKKTIDQLTGMYNRGQPESENYYCNPAYNYFEQKGVDLSQYEKKQNDKEYYFLNKSEEVDESEAYDNVTIIYEYKKITPTVLTDLPYSVDNKPLFHFKCDDN
jgi:hypothetical protein